MDPQKFTQIRHYLGKTQKQLAALLCVSPKAIQSFEQGWRNIPVSAQRQLLLLLSLKLPEEDTIPCWEKKNCPEEARINCPVWEFKVKRYCWLINGTFCQGKIQRNWSKKIEICWECEIFQGVLETIS